MRGLHALLLSVSLAAAAGDRGPGGTLEVANRKVFTFRATLAGSSPAERLASAQARLEQVPIRGPPEQVETRPLQLGAEKGTSVLVGSRLLFTVAEGDVDLAAGETTDGVAREAAQVLTEALAAEREQRSVRLLVRSLLLGFVATIIAAGVLWLFVRSRRAADLAVARACRHEGFRIRGVDFGPIALSTLRALVFFLFWALVLSVVEIRITYVLSLFPLTRPWSAALLGNVLGLLARLGRALLGGLPDLLIAVVILLIGRAVAGFVSTLVHRVEEGTAALPWVHPETAGPPDGSWWERCGWSPSPPRTRICRAPAPRPSRP